MRLSRLFFREFLEGEHGSIDHVAESILKKRFAFAAVESEFHLVEVGL